MCQVDVDDERVFQNWACTHTDRDKKRRILRVLTEQSTKTKGLTPALLAYLIQCAAFCCDALSRAFRMYQEEHSLEAQIGRLRE